MELIGEKPLNSSSSFVASLMDEVVNAEEDSSMAAAGLEQEVRGRERGMDLETWYAKRAGI